MKPMDLEFACECGTTFKASAVHDEEIREIQEWIMERHKDHQQVSPNEASAIRVAERRKLTPERYKWRKVG